MAIRMTTYDKIKIVLDANSALLKKDMELLTSKLETNRQISILKFRELKEDTEELKTHAKEINGQVKDHTKSIAVIEEKQCHDSKRRKRLWAFSFAGFTTMLGAIATYIIKQISS